jgi:hypothetical protein
MTAVLRIQKINFGDKQEASKLVRGIHSGSLVAIKRHNERTDINVRLEMKSKQATHIDEARSNKNLYFKGMSFYDIDSLKRKEHRLNSVGAFEMVFDFQDLTEYEIENFDAIKHKSLIDKFINEHEKINNYKILSYSLHLDEKNPHFHIVFSGWNDNSNAFDFNEVFNPKVQGEKMLDKNGNQIYLKHNRGKLRGEYQLDENGEKIKKYQMVRENGTQKLQDAWAVHLKEHGDKYTHRKAFTSVLHFAKGVWNRFNETTKQKIYLIREMESERIKAIKEENFELVLELETMLKNEVLGVMSIAQDIQTDQAIHRAKKGTKLSNKLINNIKG